MKKCHLGTDITDSIARRFADASRNWPSFSLVEVRDPCLGRDEQGLWQVAEQVLAPAERATLEGFRFARRRREWLAGRLAAKEAVVALRHGPGQKLTEVEIRADEHGKPHVVGRGGGSAPVHVAISHSGDRAMGLACPAPCAVDVQEIRGALARVTEKFVRAGEEESMAVCHGDRLTRLGLLWAAKEALRKQLALWPLLGFMEAELLDVRAYGTGYYLSFQAQPLQRTLPAALPGVWLTMHDKMALAIVLGD